MERGRESLRKLVLDRERERGILRTGGTDPGRLETKGWGGGCPATGEGGNVPRRGRGGCCLSSGLREESFCGEKFFKAGQEATRQTR